ncbi:hypothetical protein JMJ77_0012791, partial [Colletotrichum scovillei]
SGTRGSPHRRPAHSQVRERIIRTKLRRAKRASPLRRLGAGTCDARQVR